MGLPATLQATSLALMLASAHRPKSQRLEAQACRSEGCPPFRSLPRLTEHHMANNNEYQMPLQSRSAGCRSKSSQDESISRRFDRRMAASICSLLQSGATCRNPGRLNAGGMPFGHLACNVPAIARHNAFLNGKPGVDKRIQNIVRSQRYPRSAGQSPTRLAKMQPTSLFFLLRLS